MQWLIILLLACLSTNPAIAVKLTATSTTENPYREGITLYIWVASLNLRQQPSPSAPIIKKLAYGTPVTVLKQDVKPVPYKLAFFSYKDTADAIPQDGKQNQVILDSEWIKVKTTQQEEGYVINKLLLDIEPMKVSRNANDGQHHLEEESTDYLIRLFNLTNHQQKTKQGKEKECDRAKYTAVYHTYTSNTNKVVLETEGIDDGYQCNTGNGANISIPRFSFEKAFVFFNAFLPPVPNGFDYQAGQKFSYALDEASSGNAELKKTKNGVYFSWFNGMN